MSQLKTPRKKPKLGGQDAHGPGKTVLSRNQKNYKF